MARAAPEHVDISLPLTGVRALVLKNGGMILHWKTSLRLALEIDDFRQSYINRIMDLNDMCLGKDVSHIEAFRMASSSRGLVASF